MENGSLNIAVLLVSVHRPESFGGSSCADCAPPAVHVADASSAAKARSGFTDLPPVRRSRRGSMRRARHCYLDTLAIQRPAMRMRAECMPPAGGILLAQDSAAELAPLECALPCCRAHRRASAACERALRAARPNECTAGSEGGTIGMTEACDRRTMIFSGFLP
jgi:hypothetical protein